MKKIICILSAILLLHSSLFSSVYAISAARYCVIDAVSGRVLSAYNSGERAGMASTTKIMTAITALENAELNSVATVSKNAYGVEGSSMYLVLGEKLSLENLLYGLMLVSGNDAATAVAEHVSGSVPEFAELMNKTAVKIGAYNSHFTNPHGLSDPDHYTTAEDLARITAYALKNPTFREIVATKTTSVPWKDHEYNRRLVNHNKFLSMYEGCIGVKTGFTKSTGRCLVTAVEKNGMRLVCVTLNASDDWNDHKSLYDRAFSEYSPHKVMSGSEIPCKTQIKNGTVKEIGLSPISDIFIPLKSEEGDKIKVEYEPFEDIEAPVKKGDILGKINVKINEKNSGEFPLYATEDVPLKRMLFKINTLDFHSSLKKVFTAWLTCFE